MGTHWRACWPRSWVQLACHAWEIGSGGGSGGSRAESKVALLDQKPLFIPGINMRPGRSGHERQRERERERERDGGVLSESMLYNEIIFYSFEIVRKKRKSIRGGVLIFWPITTTTLSHVMWNTEACIYKYILFIKKGSWVRLLPRLMMNPDWFFSILSQTQQWWQSTEDTQDASRPALKSRCFPEMIRRGDMWEHKCRSGQFL